MVHINAEGKFNDNSYLIDGFLFRLPGTLSLYVIEYNGMRMLIDSGEALHSRKLVKKLKEFGAFPLHKILLTHVHWDHVDGTNKLKKMMKDIEVEVYASESGINILENPEELNEAFDEQIDPIDDVIPLKEGDIIDLNGLELQAFNFFGHTQDSIAILDQRNRNIFVGDAVIDRYDYDTFNPVLFGSSFKESELLKTYDKLKNMKDDLNSISLAHYGVWKGDDFEKIVNELEDSYHNTKDSIIQWYNENPSIEEITLKYHDKFIPKSQVHTKEKIMGLQWIIEGHINCLKLSGFIK